METTLGLLRDAVNILRALGVGAAGQRKSDEKLLIDKFLARVDSEAGHYAVERDGATQRLIVAVNELGTIGFVKMNAPVGTNDYHIISSEAIAHVYQAKRVLNLIGRSTSEVDPNKVPTEDKDLVKSAEHAVRIHQAIIDFAKDHPTDQPAVDLAVGAKATLHSYNPPKPVGGIKAEEWVRVQAIGYLSYMRALGIKIPSA